MQFQSSKAKFEAGCDEAGRGCLAGPVVAAAVILPKGFHHDWLNDSKQVPKNKRNELRKIIEEQALDWAIGICSPLEIDQINILFASILAMHRALRGLKKSYDFIAVDGNRFKPYSPELELENAILWKQSKISDSFIEFATEVKGDARFLNIAAASILAKTHRDEIMEKLDSQYPGYQWQKNAGYPTLEHRAAIQQLGITPEHRKTFQLLPAQLDLF
jgi:ribonuclease HII